MKLLAALTLAVSMAPAFANVEFGGVTFHSSVEQKQIDILKNDLRYVYQNPVLKVDNDFLAATKMQAVDGKNMHNWLLNRVRYIVGQSYELKEENIEISIRRALFFKFPETPMPEGFELLSRVNDEGEDDGGVKTVMTNIGGALYLVGKKAKVPFGLKLDNETVYVTSARTGVLQVGEGLFLKRFMINKDNEKASSNSISRLGTLFHEARHSDGNGKSTGFLHKVCPDGHPYGGYAACEIVGNGSYTIGGLAERQLLQNCTDCSQTELSGLAVKVLDSFDRVIDLAAAQKRAVMLAQVEQYKSLIQTYENIITILPERRADYQREINALKEMVAQLEKEIANLSYSPSKKPADFDATPEGKFSEMTVKQSSKLMEKSLK
ncbi:hypothetical protein [Peredibacter starrii]|uniref:Uncharacterized protein n=1 Tax=Peredibacter starrii TaxID=28202 RepID=A0AAX4HN97_9BACT|nr:hypothetical protein [Peredibacter starrii]WPU64759.1 hypothetical protein SOO65_18865 [Peredibacter starrii]